MAEANPMKSIRIEKVTLNVGVGEGGQKLENGKLLLKQITGKTPATTTSKIRSPTWGLRKGSPIGAKVTVRGEDAEKLLERAFAANDKTVKASSFDHAGNLAFGVREYIDFPGMKYDPKIGMMGFDVCVTLSRRGARVKKRRVLRVRKVGVRHKVSREDARAFIKEKFGVTLAE